MRIKTSAVFGSLNAPVDLQALSGLQDFRIQRNGYLKLGTCTACIFKSGKVQFYGLKDLSLMQETWDDFLTRIAGRTDISRADKSPYLKYITAEKNLGFTPDIPAQIVQKGKSGTVIVRKSGIVVLDGFDSAAKAEAAFLQVKERFKTALVQDQDTSESE